MKPAGLTHAEVGAFLMGVGAAMARDGVSAAAALNGARTPLLVKTIEQQGIPEDRASELLLLDLDEAVNFVDWSGT